MATDPEVPGHPVLVLLLLLVLTVGGLTLILLRLLGVVEQDWVAYLGFAMGVGSWIATRLLLKGTPAE